MLLQLKKYTFYLHFRMLSICNPLAFAKEFSLIRDPFIQKKITVLEIREPIILITVENRNDSASD